MKDRDKIEYELAGYDRLSVPDDIKAEGRIRIIVELLLDIRDILTTNHEGK